MIVANDHGAQVHPCNSDDGVLSVLVHERTPQAPLYTPQGELLIRRQASHLKFFNVRPRRVDGILTLSSELTQLEGERYASVLLDQLDRNTPRNRVRRVSEAKGGPWSQAPNRIFALDIDGLVCPPSLDPARRPQQAIRYALELVYQHWPELRGVSCHWQWSRSAGLIKADKTSGGDRLYRPGWEELRLHIWFWLSVPLAAPTLLTRVLQVNDSAGFALLDRAVYHPVQVHYTGAPRFAEGALDHIPCRSGLLRLDRDEVDGEQLAALAHPSPVLAPRGLPSNPPLPSTPFAPRPAAARALEEPPNPASSGGKALNVSYVRSAWRGVLDSIARAGDGRKGRIYAGHIRIASIAASGDLSAALGLTRNEIRRELETAALMSGHCLEDIQRDIDNGWRNGLTSPVPFSEEPSLFAKGQEIPPPTPESLSTLEEALTQARSGRTLEELREITRQITSPEYLSPGRGVLAQLPTGSGKSYALARLARAERTEPLVLIVCKDRQAALRMHDEVPRSLLLLGKRSLSTDDLLNQDWQPQITRDEEGRALDMDTCGHPHQSQFSAQGQVSTCKDCPFKSRCIQGQGTYGQWVEARRALTEGGIIILTPQLARPLLLQRLAQLDEGKPVAPFTLLAGDDLPEPSPDTLSVLDLERWFNREGGVERTPLKQALKTFTKVLRNAATDLGRHDVLKGEALVSKLLEGLSAHDLEQLQAATGRVGAPRALEGILDWLRGERPPLLGRLSAPASSSATLAVYQRSLKGLIPQETAVLMMGRTMRPFVWESYIGRRLELVREEPQLPELIEAVWLQQSTFRPESWRSSTHEQLRARVCTIAQHSAPMLRDKRVLVGAWSEVLGYADKWATVEELLLEDCDSECIHWLGVEQTGSNRFYEQGTEAVLSCGDALRNWGGHEHLCDAVSIWSGRTVDKHERRREWEADAVNKAEQLHGRARALLRAAQGLPTLLIHIGRHPPPQVRRLTQPQRIVMQAGRPSCPQNQVANWLESQGLEACSTALAKAPGCPADRRKLKAHMDASDEPRWTVRTSGRGRPQLWIGPTQEAVRRAAHWVLLRRGRSERGMEVEPRGGFVRQEREIATDPDCDGLIFVQNHVQYRDTNVIQIEPADKGLEPVWRPLSQVKVSPTDKPRALSFDFEPTDKPQGPCFDFTAGTSGPKIVPLTEHDAREDHSVPEQVQRDDVEQSYVLGLAPIESFDIESLDDDEVEHDEGELLRLAIAGKLWAIASIMDWYTPGQEDLRELPRDTFACMVQWMPSKATERVLMSMISRPRAWNWSELSLYSGLSRAKLCMWGFEEEKPGEGVDWRWSI